MDWLALAFAIELGAATGNASYTTYGDWRPEVRLETDFVVLDTLHIGGASSIFTGLPEAGQVGLRPLIGAFDFWIGLKRGRFELRYEHACVHSFAAPDILVRSPLGPYAVSAKTDVAGGDRVAVRFETPAVRF